MTDEELEEIKAMFTESDPEPWRIVTKGNSVQSHAVVSPNGNVCSGISPKTWNAGFIVSAHRLVPALVAEVERLRLENDKLRAVASTGATLIKSLQAAVEALQDPRHPIRISRREFMDLPIETRRKITERQVDAYLVANEGQTEDER